MEFYLEIVRVAVITTVLILLMYYRRGLVIARLPGFRMMLAGFSLLVFGAAIDIADDFFQLSHWHLFGDIDTSAMIKNVVGYLGGLVLLGFGLMQLLPRIVGMGGLRRKRGIMAICACCKKVRAENGEWIDIDTYLHDTVSAEFSHTYCPQCEHRSIEETEDYSI